MTDRAESETSVLFMRQLKRLHDETVDLMRVHIHQVEGTTHGAIYNQVMKHFLHHKVGAAMFLIRHHFRLDELPETDLWHRCNQWLTNYLDVLPETITQAVEICYHTLDRDRRNSLMMNSVPSDVEFNLKMLAGGRWQIEVLEMMMVQKCERSI